MIVKLKGKNPNESPQMSAQPLDKFEEKKEE